MRLPKCHRCGRELKEIIETPSSSTISWVWDEESETYKPYYLDEDDMPVSEFTCPFCGELISDEAYDFFDSHREESEGNNGR